MSKYLTYPEYSSWSNKWINKLPKSWLLVPLKYLCSGYVKDGPHETPKFLDFGIPFLSVDGIKNNKLAFDGCRYISPESHQRYAMKCHPKKGDVLLGKAASVGKVAYVDSDINFNVWSPLAVITAKSNSLGKYIYYCLQSSMLQAQCEVFSNSNTQKNLGMNTIDNLSFPYPSESEAKSISSFLDHETAKIDTLIEKQQQLIKLLKEKRQAVISHAVTKGLNTQAPMKDSGFEWLGKVPAHWTASTLKHYSEVIDCKHITAEFFDEGIPLASISEVKKWFVDLSTAKYTSEKYYNELIGGGRVPKVGDIIYSRNATVGEAAIVSEGLPPFAMGQDVCLIRLSNGLLPLFAMYVLHSGVISQQLELAMVGSTFKRINVDNIRNFAFVIPPLSEQDLIVSELEALTSKYDVLINNATNAIELMKERRTALISAAVTGKIDLRNWEQPND